MHASQSKERPHLKLIHNSALNENKKRGQGITLIASGKGGVGKTWFSITLAHCLAQREKNILLMDGDLELPNVDVQLGLMPENDLSHVLDSSVSLDDAIFKFEEGGFDILAGQAGGAQVSELTPQRIMYLKKSLKKTAQEYDHLIIDLGAGVGDDIRRLSDVAGRCIVVATAEPTSLTDAYGLIKLLHLASPNMEIEIVINQAESELEGRRTYTTLLRVCENFLNLSPKLLGVVRQDFHVRDVICSQTPILSQFPNSPAVEDVKKISRGI